MEACKKSSEMKFFFFSSFVNQHFFLLRLFCSQFVQITFICVMRSVFRFLFTIMRIQDEGRAVKERARLNFIRVETDDYIAWLREKYKST